MRVLLKVLQSGSILTNFFLSGYLIFLHEIIYDYFFYDSIHNISKKVFYLGADNYFFGALLFFAIIGETFAFYLKTRNREINLEGSLKIFILWIFHTVIAVIISMLMLDAFGYGMNDKSSPIFIVILFATVIKEFFILGFIMTPPDKPGNSKIKNIMADIFFAIFYSLAYTIVIGDVLNSGNYNNHLFSYWYNKGSFAVNILAVILLFFALYLPLRMPYFITEKHKSITGNFFSITSIILVAIMAILPLLKGESSLENALKNPLKTEMLFLNGRKITHLSGEIGKLENLKVLNLSFNRLYKLPKEFVNLKKLKWLNLGGNGFRKIPSEILNLPLLKTLDIYYNGIKSFPKDLTPFKKMDKIIIRSNRMNALEIKRIRKELGKRIMLK